jgi:hypothetical protein
MYIAGNDGTDLALAAEIRVEVDGVPGSNDMPGRILLRTTPDGSQAPVDAVKIDSAQNVTVSAGNLVIGTSGKGIDFSVNPAAPGATSELLNDYEEGTFTPTITSGTGSITSYTATGTYTKIGRVVTIAVTVTIDDAGTASGTMKYTLPFTQVATPFFTAPVREYNVTGVWYFTQIDNSGGTIWTSINGGVVWLNTYNYTWSITYFTT